MKVWGVRCFCFSSPEAKPGESERANWEIAWVPLRAAFFARGTTTVPAITLLNADPRDQPPSRKPREARRTYHASVSQRAHPLDVAMKWRRFRRFERAHFHFANATRSRLSFARVRVHPSRTKAFWLRTWRCNGQVIMPSVGPPHRSRLLLIIYQPLDI